MEFQEIAAKIIALKEADLKMRDQLIQQGELGKGYHKDMEALHHSNANLLNEIIDDIAYPTIGKVGQAASDAAWLIIQHSIGQPRFMKKCLKLLAQAVEEQQADPKHLAYLTDRIASYEGRPQRYGTSFDWDENGALSPVPYDDLAKVNQRRKSIGLNTLEEQTQRMRKQAEREQESAPADPKKRKQDYEEWRKKVGWIK